MNACLKICLWLDKTSDPSDPKIVVSRDEADTTETLRCFAPDEWNEATEFLKSCAQKEWVLATISDNYGIEIPVGQSVRCAVDEHGVCNGFAAYKDAGRYGESLKPGDRVLTEDGRGIIEHVHSTIQTGNPGSGTANYVSVDIRVAGAS